MITKTNSFILLLLIAVATSCTKYENFAGYEQSTDTEEKINLITSNEQNAIETDLFNMINEHRAGLGLNELSFESVSYYYAGEHTKYMIEKGNTSHANFAKRAEGISKRTGAVYVAENVAKNYDTIEDAFMAWLESPGHRKNLEGDYNYSAISIKENSEADKYFTQIFFR